MDKQGNNPLARQSGWIQISRCSQENLIYDEKQMNKIPEAKLQLAIDMSIKQHQSLHPIEKCFITPDVIRPSYFNFFFWSAFIIDILMIHLSKGGIETKVAGFGDCYLYIIFRCAAPWGRGCTDSKRQRGAPPRDSTWRSYLERDKKIKVHLFYRWSCSKPNFFRCFS